MDAEDDEQFTSFRAKVDGKMSDADKREADEDEIIDFVADLVGAGLTRSKTKIALEIEFKKKFDFHVVMYLRREAWKRMATQWKRPNDEYYALLLQNMLTDLSNPKLSIRHRLKLQKNLLQLGNYLPDETPSSFDEGEWANLTPAEIAKRMDENTLANDKSTLANADLAEKAEKLSSKDLEDV